jgi:hypothetical protein
VSEKLQSPPRTLSVQDLQDRARAAADAGRPDEAERLLRVAFKVAGGHQLLVSLGISLEQQGCYEQARTIFRAALAAAPDEAWLGFPLSLNLLRDGEYEEGWRLYETREVKMTAAMSGRPKLSFPEWQGQPVSSLLVLPEQGLGDEIMFNRYVRVLQARGVAVTLLCRPGLKRVFDHLGVPLLPLGPSVDIPRCDAWSLATSLPLRMATTPQTVPDPVYLPGGAGGRGIGLMATGSLQPDPRRSLPPALADDLLGVPGVVSLDPRDTGAKDFEDTRRIIEGLELVVSVDTAVAHLAGAMGKPCWTLLPFVPDWRWTASAERTPWYPQMRLFRQSSLGDWTGVHAELKAALAARATGA